MMKNGSVTDYVISTEDGKRFCDCRLNGGIPILISKEGSISLTLLLKQIENPEIAKKMRLKKRVKP